MGFFDRLFKLFPSSERKDKDGYWVSVRCDRCGELLSSRINLFNDLSFDYEAGNDPGYHCRKTLVGRSGCFQRIEVELIFDRNRKLVDHQISGGEFIEG